MKPICPITKEPCFEVDTRRPISGFKNTMLDTAAVCIRRLRKTNLETVNAIAALDGLM